MPIVIQLNRCRIAATRLQNCKFRVIDRKTLNTAREGYRMIRCLQVCVALRAIGVAGSSQANAASMIGVTGSTRRGERLLCMVHCSVMACEALLIADRVAEKSELRQMTRRALL